MRKCPICKDKFTPMYNTTQKTCNKIKCAIEQVDRDKAKKAVKDKKAASKDKRELNRNTLKWQHDQTQKAFNRMRVLEELQWFKENGLEPSCISCGKELGGDAWCCGHFKTRGAQGNLRYDRVNTYLQHNQRCNMRLSGDIEGAKNRRGYKKGLLIRFGKERGQEILDYCESHTEVKKWTCDELEGMRAEFNKRIRELKHITGD